MCDGRKEGSDPEDMDDRCIKHLMARLMHLAAHGTKAKSPTGSTRHAECERTTRRLSDAYRKAEGCA